MPINTGIATNMTSNNVTYTMIPEAAVVDIWCARYDFVVEGILIGLVSCTGLLLNIVSAVCLAKHRSTSATPFLLVSLTIADILFLASVIPIRVVHTITQYFEFNHLQPFDPYLVKYVFPLALVCQTASIYMTILVTSNRYACAKHPYTVNSTCSLKNSRAYVAVVWGFSFLYNLPRFFEWNFEEVTSSDGSNFTSLVPTAMAESTTYQYLYCNIMYCLVMFAIPLVALFVLNTLLILELRKIQRRRLVMTTAQRRGDQTSRSDHDITLILIVVVVIFIVTNAPALLTQILQVALHGEKKSCGYFLFYYARISDLLIVINSSLNFIIYILCSSRFRKILIETVFGDRCQPRGSNSQEMTTRTNNTRVTSCATKYSSLGRVNGTTQL